MESSSTLSIRHVFFRPAFLALIVACGGAPAPQGAVEDQQQDALRASAMAPSGPHMSLLDSEWEALVDPFARHFRLIGGASIRDTEVEIAWSDVASKMASVEGAQRGVLFHYGLEQGAFRTGLSFVALTPDRDPKAFTYPDYHTVQVFPIVNGAFQSAVTYSAWEKDRLNAPAPATGLYFGSVEVQRTDDPGYEELEFGEDPQLDMMPYEMEMLRLYNENSPYPETHVPYLVISCATDYDEELKSYAHRICLHMRLKPVDPGSHQVINLLDDSPRVAGSEFRMHGADLGSLCPPRCKKYAEQPA